MNLVEVACAFCRREWTSANLVRFCNRAKFWICRCMIYVLRFSAHRICRRRRNQHDETCRGRRTSDLVSANILDIRWRPEHTASAPNRVLPAQICACKFFNLYVYFVNLQWLYDTLKVEWLLCMQYSISWQQLYVRNYYFVVCGLWLWQSRPRDLMMCLYVKNFLIELSKIVGNILLVSYFGARKAYTITYVYIDKTNN